MQNQLKNEIRAIIPGKGQVRYGAAIQAAAGHLGHGSPTNPKSQVSKQIREQETKTLEEYISKQNLSLILEDLHDENVLTRNGVLYFIDTVFFLTDQFWNSAPKESDHS